MGGTVTRYAYDGAQVLTEMSGTNIVQRRYVYGPGIDTPLMVLEGSEKKYLHLDGKGSVLAASNAANAVTNKFTADAWGNGADEATSPYRFTARRVDAETGNYYYRNRYYSARQGRFMSQDPIGYGDGLNMYAYVKNDPVNRRDPSGLSGVQYSCTGSRIIKTADTQKAADAQASASCGAGQGVFNNAGAGGFSGAARGGAGGYASTATASNSEEDSCYGECVYTYSQFDGGQGYLIGTIAPSLHNYNGGFHGHSQLNSAWIIFEMFAQRAIYAGHRLAQGLIQSNSSTGAEFEAEMQSIMQNGGFADGQIPSLAQAQWIWQNNSDPNLTISVDGNMLAQIPGTTMLGGSEWWHPLDVVAAVSVFGNEPSGAISSGYDFVPLVRPLSGNWLNRTQTYIRNVLNQIAVHEHGNGTPFTFTFR